MLDKKRMPMKYIVFICSFIALAFSCIAQTDCPVIDNPAKSPEYIGGIDSLQAYFDANALSSVSEQKLVFSGSILFTVHCNGFANIQNISTKGLKKRESKRMIKRVFEIAKNIPNKWLVATHENDTPVDAGLEILYTVSQGKFKVSYKS